MNKMSVNLFPSLDNRPSRLYKSSADLRSDFGSMQSNLKNSSRALISVVTVVFNGAATIEKLINSVINQSEYIEFIVIDGGSTDDTINIIRKYEDKINYWISEPDNGIYDAMNKSLDLISGEWVLFLGCDDILLANINTLLNQFEVGKSYYGNVIMKSTGKIYDGPFSRYKLLLKNICHQSIFYDVKKIKNRKYDLKYSIAADYDLNLYLFGMKRDALFFINEKIALFNDEGLSSCKTDYVFKNDFHYLISMYYPKFYLIIYFVAKAHYLFMRVIHYMKLYLLRNLTN